MFLGGVRLLRASATEIAFPYNKNKWLVFPQKRGSDSGSPFVCAERDLQLPGQWATAPAAPSWPNAKVVPNQPTWTQYILTKIPKYECRDGLTELFSQSRQLRYL